MKRLLLVVSLATALAAVAQPLPQPGADMILTRKTAKQPDAVVESIKAYAAEKKWAFLGANKVKNGEITMVKVCIPQVGAALWSSDMKLTALLPCGNLSIYAKGDAHEVAMLHPAYMQVLYPGAESQKAVEMATPQLTGMLEEVVR